MKINKIKKVGQKYKIELEDYSSINTYADIIIKYNILYHKEIDNETINKIEYENIYYEAYQNTVKYITKKMRSEYEVRKYLEKYLISNQEKEKIIVKLKELNLINDKLFCQIYTNYKISFTNYGPYIIKKELEKLKIDETIINEVLDNVDSKIYLDKIKKIIEKKIKNNKKYSGYILKQKISLDLNNLGYSNEQIYDLINNIEIKGNIDKEYNKYFEKFKTKYSGYELEKIIEKKLYSLGYTKSEIDNIKNNSL